VRGLPPAPVDVLSLRQDFDINGKVSSVGWWLFNPSNVDAVPSDLEAIAADFFLSCLPELLAVMHTGASATTCHLETRTLKIVRDAPPNAGLYAGGQADNCALGLKWLTGAAGRGGWALTYIPAVPDRFVANNWQLNQTAWGNLLDTGSHLYNALNAILSPDGTPEVVGTLNRVASGVVLPVASFAPFVGVVPTPKLVTIRRRIPDRGGVSPAP
jgi:hypothetical protein